MTKTVHYDPATQRVSLPGHLWDDVLDALDSNQIAWEGEENSVREEHAELIDRLQNLGFYLAQHGGRTDELQGAEQ